MVDAVNYFKQGVSKVEKQILDMYNSLQEIAWHFGDHGINGKCCEDLTFIEFMALKRVYENTDISIQEIGMNLNITKSGATKIINRLERKGYVIRKNSPIDGRVCCVGATEAGVKVISKIIAKYTDYIKAILEEIEPAAIQAIKTALKILSDSTDRYHEMNRSGGVCL